MALLTFNFRSRYLLSNTTVGMILPECPGHSSTEDFYCNNKRYKVLWLLHGTSGDWSDWIRKTRIELYAAERNLIVVLPSVLNSDYKNWPSFAIGYDAEGHIIRELMPMVHNWFPASGDKEDNYIAGLSMGGQGALSYILKYPESFSAGAILSYVPVNFNNEKWMELYLKRRDNASRIRLENRINNAGGIEEYKKQNDEYNKIFHLSERGALPPLFFASGTHDRLYAEEYALFKEECHKKNVKVEFYEEEGLRHEWRFWETSIVKALDFFKL